MNWIDVTSLAIIGTLAIMGAWSGLIKSIFRLLSVGGACAATWFGTAYITEFVAPSIQTSESTLKLIVGSTLFIITLVLVLLTGKLISKLASMTPIGILDRLGGALLGITKASIILLVLLNLVLLIPIKGNFGKMVDQSIAIRTIKDFRLNPFDLDWEQVKKRGSREVQRKIMETEIPLDKNPLIPPKDSDKFDF